MNSDFSSKPIDQLYADLQSSDKGLTETIASQRLKAQQQKLKIESRFKRESKLLIRQFTNPLMLLLVIAVILSAVLGQTSDTFIILFILIASGLLSFFQELNAGRAVEKLQQMIEVKHTVIRDGKECDVKTIEVVQGDVVVLNAGDVIPADCRIIESNELHVDESTLTGESFPVEKTAASPTPPKEGLPNAQATQILPLGGGGAAIPLNKKFNCLWKSTNIVSGTAKALVINTGGDTIFGQMAHSLESSPETAFETGIKHFGFFLLKITLVLSVAILASNIYFGKPLFDSILFSLALAIGMAPELLPAIMTFAMSAGAKRMLKKKVIVKKLSSIFNFGEVNVLCTDKTGTLTEGKVVLKDIVDVEGKTNEQARLYACVNSTFQNGFANPIDDALKSLSVNTKEFEKLGEVPYDFLRKRLSIAVKGKNGNIMITKGALTNVLDTSTNYLDASGKPQALDSTAKETIMKKFADYGSEGFRVLGLSFKEISPGKINHEDEKQMTFMGFILLEDPLKEGALASINRLREMKVSIKIITGDNRYAAAHSGKALGIDSPKIMTGEELEKMSPEALTQSAFKTDIFAEIEPQQKERIIKELQKSKLVVAYMGDGINDVAAIHAADAGISTNNAVDVAKEAADFVLLEKDLSVLADGIYEGRKSFVNSMKYILINTGATFGNMFSVAGASLLLPFLPMLPKQILLTNFVTDFPYLAVASDNVDEEELKVPRKWNMKFLRKFMLVFGIHSSIFDFITFFVLWRYFKLKDSPFQTGWFLESVITELLILFIIRTKKSFLKSVPGKLLLYSSLAAFLITILLPLSPFADSLGFSIATVEQVYAIAFILIAYVFTADWLKILFFKYTKTD